MRHRKTVNHLGRTSSHRKAMMSNMASSLIMHKRIRTTLAKAKALRVYVEPLITRSKEDTTHNRREVFSYLQDNKAVTELFRVVSQRVADRPGGYTRILKLENRLGDNAEMCFIELVDFNELYTSEGAQKKGAKRTRRAGKKEGTTSAVKATPAAIAAEAPVIEEEPVAETEVVASAEETPAVDEVTVDEAAEPVGEEAPADETQDAEGTEEEEVKG
jgi:large subunit ribosomal protein L17